jgi:hypothetical protein
LACAAGKGGGGEKMEEVSLEVVWKGMGPSSTWRDGRAWVCSGSFCGCEAGATLIERVEGFNSGSSNDTLRDMVDEL